MGAARTTKKKMEPVGPFDPPLPDEAMEAEDTAREPMAVAGDKATEEESFRPTTQGRDQMARDVARRWRDPNLPNAATEETATREEDKQQERHPPGYRRSDQTGYVEMDTSEED